MAMCGLSRGAQVYRNTMYIGIALVVIAIIGTSISSGLFFADKIGLGLTITLTTSEFITASLGLILTALGTYRLKGISKDLAGIANSTQQ